LDFARLTPDTWHDGGGSEGGCLKKLASGQAMPGSPLPPRSATAKRQARVVVRSHSEEHNVPVEITYRRN